jgi:tRNA wybutosine-synthesizing protein 3
LHFLTASLGDANAILTAASQAGFRESGAINLAKSADGILNPMVAVRSMGLAFDAIIGYQDSDGAAVSFVDETYLTRLVQIGNERFKTNSERIGRFRSYLLKEYSPNAENRGREDAAERRQRKRVEGLAKQHERKKQIVPDASDMLDDYEFDPGTFVE